MRVKNWRKCLSVGLIAVMLFRSQAAAATIGNIQCNITSNETVLISYQITGKGTYTVSIQVSLDGGKTFPIKPTALSGDVGKGIGPGANRLIEWDVFRDIDRLTGDMVIMLEATQEPGKPVNKLYILAGLVLVGGAVALMSGGGETGKETEGPIPVIQFGTVLVEIFFPE
ncbi:hypothetical protein LLG96_14820 [bacterium]|nr:hypothetical protein [bacterium]